MLSIRSCKIHVRPIGVSVPYLLLRGINNGVMAPGDQVKHHYTTNNTVMTQILKAGDLKIKNWMNGCKFR